MLIPDAKLERNRVAGFLALLRHMLCGHLANQNSLVRDNEVAMLGALLQKVEPSLLDINVLMAVQLLVDAVAATNQTLLHHIYQYLLFDFRVWSKTDFPVRIGK